MRRREIAGRTLEEATEFPELGDLPTVPLEERVRIRDVL